MTLIAAVAGFFLVALLITITPGLDTALVLRTTITRGVRHGWAATVGISTGVLVWASLAAVGIATLLAASQVAFTVLRLVGAAYMIWLGGRLLVKAMRGQSHSADVDVPEGSAWASFRHGLLTNLLNPKVGAFYVAILPQFLVPGVAPLALGSLLGLVHAGLGIIWCGALIAASRAASGWLAQPAVTRWVDGIAGGVIAGFGVRLALGR